MRKRAIGARVTMRNKSDRVRVHLEKERWGKLTIRKNDGVRVGHEKKSNGVKVHHEKERWCESSPKETGIM